MTHPTVHLAASGHIALEIPSVLAEGRSHTVEIPLTMNGLSLLKTILVQRQRDAKEATIGRKSSPTASMVHEFLQNKDRQDKAAAKAVSDNLVAKFADIELEL